MSNRFSKSFPESSSQMQHDCAKIWRSASKTVSMESAPETPKYAAYSANCLVA